MELLTEDQITAELASLPAWTREGSDGSDGNAITTVTTRQDFRDALLYVGAVAYLAESAGHHPDIAIAWNKVTLTLSTHSAGGLTANDFALARQISALA
jgi:4a-hydroxytetrahydrobiopterin dehydratase